MRRGAAVGIILVLVIIGIGAIMFFDLPGAFATGTTLEYKFKKGDVDKYRISMDLKMSMPGMPAGLMPSTMNMKYGMTMIQETLSTSFNGNAKVRMTMKDMKLDMPGMPGMPMMGQGGLSSMPQMPPTVITCTMTRDGKITDIEGPQKSTPGMGFGGSGQLGQFSTFPRRKIPVGGTWTEKMTILDKAGNVVVTSNLMAADVPVWTEKACKIKQTFSGKMTMDELMSGLGNAFSGGKQNNKQDVNGSVEVSGDSLIFFSPSLGKMLKTDGKFSAKIVVDTPSQVAGNGMPPKFTMIIDGKIHVTRFK